MSKNDKPKSDKPNILFTMSDDIGWFNLSCYNHDDPTVDPQFVRIGKPTIENTGLLTRKRCFTTDDGAEIMSWPDGGSTPFRGEKDRNWEGGWRVPFVMQRPGVSKPGRVINDICSLPTAAFSTASFNLNEVVEAFTPHP